MLKDLLNRDGEMCVVLIFDICNVYEIFAVLRPRKNGRYGFEISRKYQRFTFVFILLARLIWFCEAAKTKSVYFPNFKRMTCYQSYLHWCRGGKADVQEHIFQRSGPSKNQKKSKVGPRVATKASNFYYPDPLPLLPYPLENLEALLL